jgi:hypothetical protein
LPAGVRPGVAAHTRFAVVVFVAIFTDIYDTPCVLSGPVARSTVQFTFVFFSIAVVVLSVADFLGAGIDVGVFVIAVDAFELTVFITSLDAVAIAIFICALIAGSVFTVAVLVFPIPADIFGVRMNIRVVVVAIFARIPAALVTVLPVAVIILIDTFSAVVLTVLVI